MFKALLEADELKRYILDIQQKLLDEYEHVGIARDGDACIFKIKDTGIDVTATLSPSGTPGVLRTNVKGVVNGEPKDIDGGCQRERASDQIIWIVSRMLE